MTGQALCFALAIAAVFGGAIGFYFQVYLAIMASLAVAAAFGALNLQLGMMTAFRDAGLACWVVQAGFLGAVAIQAWRPRESALIHAPWGWATGRSERGRR